MVCVFNSPLQHKRDISISYNVAGNAGSNTMGLLTVFAIVVQFGSPAGLNRGI